MIVKGGDALLLVIAKGGDTLLLVIARGTGDMGGVSGAL